MFGVGLYVLCWLALCFVFMFILHLSRHICDMKALEEKEIRQVFKSIVGYIKSRKTRKTTVYVNGEGPYVSGGRGQIFVQVRIGRKEFNYSNVTGKHVLSNYPYGLDLINALGDEFAEVHVKDLYHTPGRHGWLVTIRK